MQEENTEVLSHHGILGMKWGIRRYQNRDGTLTAAGRKRVAKMKDEYTQLTGKKLIRKPTSKADTKKSVRDLSDTELRSKINRLQMEKQAIGLQNDLSSNGSKFVKTVGKSVIAPAAIDAGKRLLTDLFMKIGKSQLGLNPKQTKDVLSDLKQEVDELELKKRKAVAEDYFKKREEKESHRESSNNSNNNSNKSRSEDKTERVYAEFVGKKEHNSNTESRYENTNRYEDKNVMEATWYEAPADSTALVPYTKKGSSFIDDLFKKKK